MSGREIFLEFYQVARKEGRAALLEHESVEVCRGYGLALPPSGVATSPEQAAAVADALGFPVVMKVISPQVLHKSDVGGVRVGIDGPGQAVAAYQEIQKSVEKHFPGADIRGQLITRMAPEGVETIVGFKRDQVFGPVVMFGIGGIFVEVYKDVSFRLCPVSKGEAERMIGELEGTTLLEGFRGMASANLNELAQVILSLGSLGAENQEIGSIDLNPVRVNGEGALALDARILLAAESLQ